MIDTKVQHGVMGGMVVTPRITQSRKACSSKSYYRYSGICSDVRFGAHRNGITNLSRAIAERVLMVPDGLGGLKACPKPKTYAYVRNTLHSFHQQLLRDVLNDSSFPIPPLSDDGFVSMYSGAKKKRYQAACDSLSLSPVIQKDARVSCFVKVEKINFSSKVDPCPRVIQPRTFRYSAALGKHIKHLEKPLFKLIDNLFGGPTVLKGYDCIASGKHLSDMWSQFKNPVAIGVDASRFDQHCSHHILRWEQSIWNLLASDKASLRRLLKWQLNNVGCGYVDDGKIKYNVKGCRMSGDMNTSSGNCLVMCAMMWSYLKSIGVSKFRLANNGDDCVIIVESCDYTRLNTLPNWFLNMGFTMKVENPVYELEKIVFCQTQPVWDGVGYRMVRDPRVSLSKDLTSTLDLSNLRTRALWHNAMHHGGKALTVGIPVYQQFYEMFPKSSIKEKCSETTLSQFHTSGFSRMTPKVKQEQRSISDRSRFSFWLAFGLTPDTQIMLENRFSSIKLDLCCETLSQDYAELSILVEN